MGLPAYMNRTEWIEAGQMECDGLAADAGSEKIVAFRLRHRRSMEAVVDQHETDLPLWSQSAARQRGISCDTHISGLQGTLAR